MVGQVSTILAEDNLNIVDLLNKSRGEIAYTIIDLETEVSAATADRIRSIEGVLRVRNLGIPVS
jgi:D-3-phosphoglycerate dehydrogenase